MCFMYEIAALAVLARNDVWKNVIARALVPEAISNMRKRRLPYILQA